MRRDCTHQATLARAAGRRLAMTGLLLALAIAGLSAVVAAPLRLEDVPAAQRATVRADRDAIAALSPDQRVALLQRVAAWQVATPVQRAQRRSAWQAWLQLPAADQQAMQASAVAFAALAPDVQQALRARFDALDGSLRNGWQLGPVLGADYARLHPLLAQVPEGERDRLLATLQALTPVQRDALALLVQRTPPQRRDALRRALLSTDAANRTAWLQDELDR